MRRLLVCLALAGCAAPVLEPPVPPPAPAIVAPAATAPDTLASRLVKRDTKALQGQARRYAAKPGVPIEAVLSLDPLTRNVKRTLAAMEMHHTRLGYRPADVAAARAAAEAVAAFLASQGASALPASEMLQ